MPQPEPSGPQTPSLDIITVNWNSGDQLRRCLASLPTEPAGFVIQRVVVVDNASTDHSLLGLSELALPLLLIPNAENKGFAAACNIGAAGSAADYLLFLNPDTLLNGDSLAEPIAYLERPVNRDVGVCSIRLVDDLGVPARTCTRLPTPPHFAVKIFGLDRLWPSRFPSHFMNEWDHGDSRDVDHVMGAFYLIRRPLFRALCGFDERFFVYLEDLDLSLRVHSAGYRVHFLASASAYHKGGGTSEQAKSARLAYSLRSRILYGFKHFRRSSAILLMAATLVLEPFTRLAFAVVRRSPSLLMETLGGFATLWTSGPPWRSGRR